MKTVLKSAIIGDNTVEYHLLTEVRNLGATGYTCYPCPRPRRKGCAAEARGTGQDQD
jgi:hypothetical protein